MNTTVRCKLKRLVDGDPPRVLDLFAGCGGLTLGFVRAGCESLGAVEFDSHAVRSHALNFHGGEKMHSTPHDITKTDPIRFLEALGERKPHHAVDMLVGGPPCPAFTRVGRAKLREIGNHPEAHLIDPRAQLYLPYLQYVEALSPVAILMENVPDIMNWSGINLAEVICEKLERMGYRCRYTLLNAAHYGVPQMRERFFLVAIHQEAGTDIEFPRPVCFVDFPPGYRGSRNVAMRKLRDDGHSSPSRNFVVSPEPMDDAPGPVSVADAISDLPPIAGHLDGTLRRGARSLDLPVEYRAQHNHSAYARLMRKWPGFATNGETVGHVIRSLSHRDYRLFRSMKPGDDYPKAHALATRFFEEALSDARARGQRIPEHSAPWRDLLRSYIPPYDHTKFPNKWRKMESGLPARTLMAHLGKDSYSHIHPESKQARVISVREAARLQSFPDGFRFCGTMNPALRQIGNAVPPLLAWAIAEKLVAIFRGGKKATRHSWRDEIDAVLRARQPDKPLARAT